MNRDKVEGTAKDVMGRIERKAGQALDDPSMAAKGAAKQVEGKVQKGIGAVKDAVKRDHHETKPRGGADGTEGNSGSGRGGAL